MPPAEPPPPDLPWPDFATPAILALLTGEERKPPRAVSWAGRDAVDAGITRLKLTDLSGWGGGQGSAPWGGAPFEAVRLPALRHLNLYLPPFGWATHGAAYMRAVARLVAAHAPALRTLRLSFRVTSQPKSHHELAMAALEVGFLESVLLAAPLPVLRRLNLNVEFAAAHEARCLEALRPLARLSLPRLARLSLWAGRAAGQGVRWLEGAHLPALRHLGVIDLSAFRPDHPCVVALSAPRWSALEALELSVLTCGGSMEAFSAALAPTLRRLEVCGWPFGREGCAEEWPQLRSLEIWTRGTLAQDLGPVRLPRLERLAAFRVGSAAGFLEGFAALRPSIPTLRVVELKACICSNEACEVVGCTDPETLKLLVELRAAWPGLELRRWRLDDWTQA
jgi:hypothetical protein